MMRDDRGQALLFMVLVAGLAATVMAGISLTQERLVLEAREGRSGEAAAQAAGAVVADAQLDFVGLRDEAGNSREPSLAEIRAFLLDPSVHERALAAARELALLNGGQIPRAVVLQDGGTSIYINVDGVVRWYRVSIDKVPCCVR